jgi:glycosyltransferase involved in cell wall biosynthesis
MALISVVIPVYHNADSLPLLMEKLREISSANAKDGFEFVFVEDGSGDNSFNILMGMARDDPRVRIIKLSRNFGSNPAILAGLNYARGDCAVVIAADLQDPPELIPQLVEIWHEGNQVVLGARRRRNDPLISKLFATAFNRLFRRFVFSDYPPDGFDFMLIDRCVIDILIALKEKNSYIFGQVLWVGFKRQVIYYDRVKRKHGYSRWTVTKKIKYFIDAFAAFSYLPLRAASTLGFVLATLGFLYALLIIGLRLFKGIQVAGWASLTVVVLITSGAQLVLIGVLGEYLWRALDETRRRPPFIVESVLNIDSGPKNIPAECNKNY